MRAQVEDVLATTARGEQVWPEIDYADIPDAVAVAEAVALVGDLSTDDSPAFVNGVLGSITATKVA